MLLKLFSTLSQALSDSAYIALVASFLWGMLSVILSPCHFSTIPLIVGFISEQKIQTLKKAFSLSFLFSIGTLITISLIGIFTSLSGRILGDIGSLGNYITAIILILAGIHLMDIFYLPTCNISHHKLADFSPKGATAALLLGLVYGLALGPCTFAYMIPILGLAFSSASENIIFAILLVLLYALGHCSVIVLVGTSSEWVQKHLHKPSSSVIIKKICGLLVIAGGIYLIFK